MTAAPTPAKKRSTGKLILKLCGALVLLLVIAVVIIFFSLNSIVRWGVTSGGEHATGQTTNLVSADLSLGAGTVNLSQLDIANLPDYKEPKFLIMKQCDVQVESGSLFTPTAVVDLIQISGLEITVETNQNLKNNLSDLMAILQKNSPAASAPAAGGGAPSDSPGKKLKIVKIKLASTKVHLRGIVTMDLDLGPIEIDDPTNPDGRPMKIADLMAKVLLHVAQQIVDNPQIPGNIKDSMKNVQALVNSLRGELQKDLGKDLKNLQNLGKNIPNAGKDVQNAEKGLQNLLGGNKSTQPK